MTEHHPDCDAAEGWGSCKCGADLYPDHDNHVRMYRAHQSYFALAGMVPMKEASNLACKASIAGMKGDLDEMIKLMLDAQIKADEYADFIRRQIYQMHPEFDPRYQGDPYGFKLTKWLKQWPAARGIVGRWQRLADWRRHG